MWETCLKHSTEILTLILGSGILGYLFSKWFGPSPEDDRMRAEYENQINSINTRLRNQDAELKNAHSVQSSWAAEKTGLLAKIDDLSAALADSKNVFTGYVSPAEYQALQSRFDQDMKLAVEQFEALSNEKSNLQKALSNLETKAHNTALNFEVKLKELESQLQAAINDKANLEARAAIDIESKSKQLMDLQNRFAETTSKSSEVNNEVDAYKSSIENLKQALLGAEDQLASRDKEYLSKLFQAETDLNIANKALTEVTAKLNQTGETHLAELAKFNEVNARVHQLENELSQSRVQAQIQKEKNAELEKISAALMESDRKVKEWEARWREVSTEADQFKVAHANQIRVQETLLESLNLSEARLKESAIDRDRLVQEWETKWKEITIEANQLKESQSEWINERDSLNQNLLQLEAQLQTSQTEKNQLVQEWKTKLNEITVEANQLKLSQSEWLNERDNLNQNLLQLEAQLQTSQTEKNQLVQEWETKWNEITNESNQLKLSQSEWLNERDSLNQNLQQLEALLQTSQNEKNQLVQEWETKWNEITIEANQLKLSQSEWLNERDNLNQNLLQLEAQLQTSQTEKNQLVQEWETKWNEITNESNQLKTVEADLRSERDALKQNLIQLEVQLQTFRDEKNQIEKDSEAKWKELDGQTEEVKLALANALKERDGLRQRINQLESEIISATHQIEQIRESNDTEWNERISELNSKLEQVGKESHHWQIQSESLQAEMEHQKTYVQEANVKLIETNKQYEAQLNTAEGLSYRINELENLIQIRENELSVIHNQLAEAREKVNSIQSAEANAIQQLAEMENRYRDITNRFNMVQAHLSDLQKSANSSAQQVMDLETRNKELNDKANSLQQELTEAHKANDTGNRHLNGVEAQNKELLIQLENLNKQIEDHKASEHTAKQIQEATDNKYKELASKFNTVQLQLADELRSKSHLEETIAKKMDDINHKHQTELMIWQKKIIDLEKDFSQKESIYKSQITQLESIPPEIIEKIIEVPKIVEKLVEVPKIVEKIVTVEKIVNLPSLAPNPKVEVPAIAPVVKKPAKIVLSKPTKAVSIAESPAGDSKSKAEIAVPSTDWKSVSARFGKKIKSDDHVILEGIGPKINSLLKKSKITTWLQLAESSVQDIQKILDKGGNKFSLADPTSWPKQARLAALGKWDELKKFQLELIENRKLKTKPTTKVSDIKATTKTAKQKIKAEIKPVVKPAAKPVVKPVLKTTTKPIAKEVPKQEKSLSKPSPKSGAIKNKPLDITKGAVVLGKKFKVDDLKIIEGIGPKIDSLLKKAGIKTWKKMAQTDTKSLQKILDKAGTNFVLADPKTWPKQAGLAADGAWEKLKKMQAGLK